MSPHLQRLSQFTSTQDLHRPSAADQAAREQGFWIQIGADRSEPGHVHDGVLDAKDVGESALRNATEQRHLTALEAGALTEAGARSLSFVTPARCLACSRPRTPSQPLTVPAAAFFRRQLMQLHDASSRISTKCGILATLPRVAGQSSLSTTDEILRKPSPRRTSRCLFVQPMVLLIWRTRIVGFALLMQSSLRLGLAPLRRVHFLLRSARLENPALHLSVEGRAVDEPPPLFSVASDRSS